MSTSIRILCIGLEGPSRESAHSFIFPIIHQFRAAKLVDSMHFATLEIVHRRCPYDIIFLACDLPETFLAPVGAGNMRFNIPPGLTPAESIVIGALEQNPNVRFILHNPSGKPLAMFQHRIVRENCMQINVHHTDETIDWREAFLKSPVTSEFAEKLGLTATA